MADRLKISHFYFLVFDIFGYILLYSGTRNKKGPKIGPFLFLIIISLNLPGVNELPKYNICLSDDFVTMFRHSLIFVANRKLLWAIIRGLILGLIKTNFNIF